MSIGLHHITHNSNFQPQTFSPIIPNPIQILCKKKKKVKGFVSRNSSTFLEIVVYVAN